MASKKLEKIILNLFEPNITESISADDMRIFTSAIFQASESVIHKFINPDEVDDFRNSSPDIPIYKNDIVILTDTKEPGIYLSGIDQPFFKDLILIADLSTDLDEILNVSVKNPREGDTLVYNSKYKQWVNKAYNGVSNTTERPEMPYDGMMFFDSILGKPIWFNSHYNRWVDSNGKTI